MSLFLLKVSLPKKLYLGNPRGFGVEEGRGSVRSWRRAAGGEEPTVPLQHRSLSVAPSFAVATAPGLENGRSQSLPSLYAPPQAVHCGPEGPPSAVYYHHRHQGRLSGAVSAAWAVCSRTWSSWTSRRRASSSSAWAWTWACSVVTRTSRWLSWPFKGWSFGCSSISQRYPWGVGSWWAVNSPLPMRRRIVSVDTPKRRAASPTDTFSTTFLPLGMGNSIGFCLGNRLGAAWASSGRFLPGSAFYRGAVVDRLPALTARANKS